jgi:ankyrin repeat protein
MAALLLTHGAQVNVKDKDDGTAALMDAVAIINIEINNLPKTGLFLTKLLLAHGAEVNARDKDGSTALMEAAQDDNADKARLLLAHGAQVNVKDKDGETALDMARSEQQIERLLRQAGAR